MKETTKKIGPAAEGAAQPAHDNRGGKIGDTTGGPSQAEKAVEVATGVAKPDKSDRPIK